MADVGRNVGVAELYLVEELGPALRVEGRQAHHHLVDQRSQAPPVDRLPVALLVENLGSQVLRGSADREGVAVGNVHFGEAEVGEPEVAAVVDEDVFGLEAG